MPVVEPVMCHCVHCQLPLQEVGGYVAVMCTPSCLVCNEVFMHVMMLLLCLGHGVVCADLKIPLTVASTKIPADVIAKYPHLYGCTHLQIPDEYLNQV